MKSVDINLTYLGYLEYILDRNIKPGVGYGIVYEILNDMNDQINIENQISEKRRELYEYYIIQNKNDNENDFYKFLNYVNADTYLSDMIKNERYTENDVKSINIQKDFFKDDIIININVFLPYLYKNILKTEKDEKFLEKIIIKYADAYILLIERIYKKYIKEDFIIIKEPDSYFENITVLQ